MYCVTYFKTYYMNALSVTKIPSIYEYLVIRDAELLTQFKVDVDEIPVSNPLSVEINPSVFDVCRKVGGVDSVECLRLTFKN